MFRMFNCFQDSPRLKDHCVGAGEVEAHAAGARRRNEEEDARVVVEALDEALAPVDARTSALPRAGDWPQPTPSSVYGGGRGDDAPIFRY